MLKNATVAQLDRMLLAKQAKLEDLQSRRQKLIRALDEVNRKIAALERSPPQVGRRGRLGQNDRPLIQYIVEILDQNKKGLNLRALEEKILAAGYKTQSTNFGQTLYQSIYHHRNKVCHDAPSGTYRLVSKPAARNKDAAKPSRGS